MTNKDKFNRSQEDMRLEITQRIDRETAYTLKLVGCMTFDGHGVEEKFLKEKIADNDKIIELLGKYLESQGCDWEKFYRDKDDNSGYKYG